MSIGSIVYCLAMIGFAEPVMMKATIVDNKVFLCQNGNNQCDEAIEVELQNGDYQTYYKNDCLTKKPKRNK